MTARAAVPAPLDDTINSCATTAAAMTSGSLPSMPGTPIGQVMRPMRSAAMPRCSKRWMKRWRFVFEPIRPKKPKSPRARIASLMRRSRSWRCVSTR